MTILWKVIEQLLRWFKRVASCKTILRNKISIIISRLLLVKWSRGIEMSWVCNSKKICRVICIIKKIKEAQLEWHQRIMDLDETDRQLMFIVSKNQLYWVCNHQFLWSSCLTVRMWNQLRIHESSKIRIPRKMLSMLKRFRDTRTH